MQYAETLAADRRPWRRGDVARLGATAITVAVTLAATLTGATLRLTSDRATDAPAAGAPAGAVALPASQPVSVRIPAIDLETNRIVDLGRAPSGAIEVPAAAATVGWLRTGVTPGEAGAAVVVGHSGLGYARGVFHAAGQLRPGDTVTVARADGIAVTFAVYDVAHPTGVSAAVELATAPTGRPELRLVTWTPHNPGERTQAHATVVLAAITEISRDPITTGQ